MKYPHFEQLQQEVAEGWVEKNTHPMLPLSIYNYSRKTQFENNWNEVRKQCRGLILDNEGKIVAMCFPKFFNYEEIHFKDEIPFETPVIENKEDGSLGIIFHYNDEWHVATRGSFLSEQAIKGKEILNKHRCKEHLCKDATYLVEIIYPENRIVINYKGEEKFIWLTIFNNKTGKELSIRECNEEWDQCFIFVEERVYGYYGNQFNENIFKELKLQYKENTEGFVIRFIPSNYRVKIKFEEYIRLHKLLTNVNAVDIWECLKNGDDINKILEQVPDEFDNWVKNIIKDLENQAENIYKECSRLKDNMFLELDNDSSRKDYAMWILSNVKSRYQGVVFNMLDGKDFKSYIYKLIKPTNKKAFWNDKATV